MANCMFPVQNNFYCIRKTLPGTHHAKTFSFKVNKLNHISSKKRQSSNWMHGSGCIVGTFEDHQYNYRIFSLLIYHVAGLMSLN